MRVIDVHAHWFPQDWISLLEKEGAANGATIGRTAKGHVSFEFPGAPLKSVFRPDMIELGTLLKLMDEAKMDVRAFSLTNPMVYWAPPQFGLKLSRAFNDACAAGLAVASKARLRPGLLV